MFHYINRPFYVSPSYLILSKNNDENIEFMAKFKKGFAKLAASGRYKEFLDVLKTGYYLKK